MAIDDLFKPQKTLKQATEEFQRELKDNHAAICQLCSKRTTIWKRWLSATLIKPLIVLYHHDRQHPGEWKHLVGDVNYSTLGVDYGKLIHFGLIENMSKELKKQGKPYKRKDGNPCAGKYRITELGRSFVRGEVKIRDHVYVLDNSVIEVQGDTFTLIDVRQALGKEFNYDELMASVRPVSASSGA